MLVFGFITRYVFYGPFWASGGLLAGILILGWGVPSSVGRRGESQASPSAPVGRQGGRPSERSRTAPIGNNKGCASEVLWRGGNQT